MRLFLILCSFFAAIPAFGDSPKYLYFLRNASLAPSEGGFYELNLFFDEKRPGVPSRNVSADGCSLRARSTGNFLFMARYRVSLEQEQRPGSWDNRWWKSYTSQATGFDFWVQCKSRTRVSEDYVRRVMAGYLRVER